MSEIPERLNIAEWFLAARVVEGNGDRVAVRTDAGVHTYLEVQEAACRWASWLRSLDIRPEERVIIALPDSPEWVASFFGILRTGAVVVMVNPYLRTEQIRYFLEYTRARAAIVHADLLESFAEAAGLGSEDARGRAELGDGTVATPSAAHLRQLLVVGVDGTERSLAHADSTSECFDSHRDDPAVWLFSGGTTGMPKAVVQPHSSFVNTTRCYGHGVIGYRPDDVTVSVPKLFFGYATGSNLLFPFSVGASVVLFGDRCTPDRLFELVAQHRPTILINVPTMINQMLAESGAEARDLSSLRICTSAGEALPAELHDRWQRDFGVELLDGLGTAEQWHIFLSNRPGDVRPGTLGKVVPGFEIRLCDDHGNDVADGEVGIMRVAGGSRALGYWQRQHRNLEAFHGDWYVSGDMLRRDADGYYVYCGRSDDMLKVSGKWMAPGEVENVLLQHPGVHEAAVVGVEVDGLTVPHAFVVPVDGQPAADDLAGALQAHVRERLETYKCPRAVHVLEDFPRTHLGKVDRGALKAR